MPLAVLIPAYNAARSLPDVLGRIRCLREGDVVIVADDGSSDGTSAIAARDPRVRVIRHPRNLGYGRTSATLYDEARRLGATVTVNIHADAAHFPEDIPRVIGPILGDEADVVIGSRTLGIMATAPRLLGSRRLGACFAGPMPAHRFLSNLALTAYQNVCYGTSFHSFHDGFRACSRRVLEAVRYQRFTGWYQFDTEFLLAADRAGFRIQECGARTRYLRRPTSATPPIRYGLRVVAHATQHGLRRLLLRPDRGPRGGLLTRSGA